jgi:hypothetical protein
MEGNPMTTIRIAVASAIVAAFVAASAGYATSRPAPAHHLASAITCCDTTNMGQS